MEQLFDYISKRIDLTKDVKEFTKSISTIKKLKKTSITVSHRLNALKNCDKVYVIKNKETVLIKKNKLKKYFEKSS